MRLTPLLWLVIPLLGTGWVSIEARSGAPLEGPPLISTTRSHVDPPLVEESAGHHRRIVDSQALVTDAFEIPPVHAFEIVEAAELPLLPFKPLLDKDATPAQYSEWYSGTSSEHLCQNLVRLNTLRRWDPEKCSCVTTELFLLRTAAHERVHTLNEQKELLKKEEDWLREEIQRQVQVDLKSGRSLLVFRLPGTATQMRERLSGLSKEELMVQKQLLGEAKRATRRAAVEAEFAAGNYKVSPALVWG
jgi:hypothetical protein